MTKLIDMIYDYLVKRIEIPEELLYEFPQNILKMIQNHATSEIPSAFWNLQHYVEMFWRGKKYKKEKNTALVYQMGQLLACTNMIRDIVDADEKIMNLNEYAKRWVNKYPVYKGIHDNPGINHKKLAEISGNSVSSLSQFISKTKWDGYIIYRSGGREKYYYLTQNGEKLYKLLREKRQKSFRLKKYTFRNWESNNSGYLYLTVGNEKMAALLISENGRKSDIHELLISNSMENLDKEGYEGDYKAIKKEALYAGEGIGFV